MTVFRAKEEILCPRGPFHVKRPPFPVSTQKRVRPQSDEELRWGGSAALAQPDRCKPRRAGGRGAAFHDLGITRPMRDHLPWPGPGSRLPLHDKNDRY